MNTTLKKTISETKAMAENTDENTERKNNPFRLVGMVLTRLPSLILRFGGVFLKFKRQAKKGGRIFRKELLRQGISKETATELTDIYLEGSDILQYMHYFN